MHAYVELLARSPSTLALALAARNAERRPTDAEVRCAFDQDGVHPRQWRGTLRALEVLLDSPDTVGGADPTTAPAPSPVREVGLDHRGDPVAQLTAEGGVDPVKDYLRRIGPTALLSADEEVDLGKRIETGLFAQYKLARERFASAKAQRELELLAEDGARAKALLVEANLRLVVSIAKRFTGAGLQFLDVVQEGNIGLIRAVEGFDYRKGFKFSTYATWCIRHGITRALADQGRTIRIPVHTGEAVRKAVSAKRQMLAELDREPTAGELAARLDLPCARVAELLSYHVDPLSLHVRPFDNSAAELGDLLADEAEPAPEEAVAHTLLREDLLKALATLQPREADVLSRRFGLTDGLRWSHAQIGAVHGIGRGRVRQIEALAMSKLRHPARSPGLEEYLDL